MAANRNRGTVAERVAEANAYANRKVEENRQTDSLLTRIHLYMVKRPWVGLLFAPVDAAVGFAVGARGFYRALTAKGFKPYMWEQVRQLMTNYVPTKLDDPAGTGVTFTTGLGRTGALVGFGIGLAIAAAIPFPGTTLLYVALVVGVPLMWSLIGRAAGALFGAVIDFIGINLKINRFKKDMPPAERKDLFREDPDSDPTAGKFFGRFLAVSLFGEGAQKVKEFVKGASRVDVSAGLVNAAPKVEAVTPPNGAGTRAVMHGLSVEDQKLIPGNPNFDTSKAEAEAKARAEAKAKAKPAASSKPLYSSPANPRGSIIVTDGSAAPLKELDNPESKPSQSGMGRKQSS